MALLPIIEGEDTPVLRTKTQKVPAVTKEILKLLKDMEETMVNVDGLGIAAPQVDHSLRMCIAKINNKNTILINPEITWRSDDIREMEEGCLSLPKVDVKVPRAFEIIFKYTDEKGQEQERRVSGLDARVVQHEYDHLEGILIVDYR